MKWSNWHNRYNGQGENPGTDCSHDQDLARQEYAADADINNIIKRIMNGDSSMLRSTIHGLVDYTQDLTDAYAAVDALRIAYHDLPEHVRNTMTQEEFIDRLAAGERIETVPDEETVTQITDETPKTDV